MLEDPGLDPQELVAALRAAWAVDATAFTFVPGFDMRAASFEVATTGASVFLKVRFGPVAEAPLEVPRALLEAGVVNVLAPLRTPAGGLWQALGDRSLVLYPFVRGRSAMDVGMSADQWRTFGATLRAVHDSPLAERFADRLPAETFGLASATTVRRVLARPSRPTRPSAGSPARRRLGALLRAQADRIEATLERAEELGRRLAGHPLARVLCHADIHAANVLVADDGRIFLVDWDGPMLAPRERDLLFVIGSRIARVVEPDEEAWFFEGYGDVPVDREAIVYYRYERIVEDIGEFASSVLDDPDLPEVSRTPQVALVEGFFRPGGVLDTAERV